MEFCALPGRRTAPEVDRPAEQCKSHAGGAQPVCQHRSLPGQHAHTHDEEHRKSEKEGRALNALAEMCEREQNAAAAAVANAKRDLAANRME
eukprot:scaffold108981_cov17-Tisochrysis_lutea.AAC.3